MSGFVEQDSALTTIGEELAVGRPDGGYCAAARIGLLQEIGQSDRFFGGGGLGKERRQSANKQ